MASGDEGAALPRLPALLPASCILSLLLAYIIAREASLPYPPFWLPCVLPCVRPACSPALPPPTCSPSLTPSLLDLLWLLHSSPPPADAVAKQLRIRLVPEMVDLGGETLKTIGEYRLPLKLVLPTGNRVQLDVTVAST